jgi:hypothetical protein
MDDDARPSPYITQNKKEHSLCIVHKLQYIATAAAAAAASAAASAAAAAPY